MSSNPPQNHPCRVCEDPNGQSHYGTICCPSCKGFFRRVFISSKKFECNRGNMCVIKKKDRNICRACRYKKCLKVGMNVNDIRERNQKSSPSVEKNSGESSGFQEFENSQSSENKANPGNCSEFEVADIIQMAQGYMNIEKYCENTFCDSNMTTEEENSLIDQMLSSSIVELIEKKSPQCPRFKRIWKPHEMLSCSNFCRSWSRSIVHFMDYATKFPIYNQMSLNDRRIWFTNRLGPCTFLTMAYHTRVEMCEGLLFGCSNVFPLQKEQWSEVDDVSLRNVFSSITKTLFIGVIYPFISMKLTDIHYSLLKTCLFYYPNLMIFSASAHCYETMKAEYDRHKNALFKLSSDMGKSFDEQTKIIFQLEDIFNTLERISTYFDDEVQYFYLIGVPLIRKKLLTDIHVLNAD